MDYPPNTRLLKRGMYALHECDAKEPRMLMQVQGIRRSDGAYRMRYVHPDFHARSPASGKKDWFNGLASLLDPAEFGISLSETDGGALLIECDPAKGTIRYADGKPVRYPSAQIETINPVKALPFVPRTPP